MASLLSMRHVTRHLPRWQLSSHSSLGAWQRTDDVGVARIRDGKDTDSVVPTAGRAELVVVAVEVMHAGLGQHGVILDLALPQCRAVGGDEDELGFALPQTLQRGLVTKTVLAALDDKLKARVDGVGVLGSLRLLLSDHGSEEKRKEA